jgi:hypothetical protein
LEGSGGGLRFYGTGRTRPKTDDETGA